MQKELNTPLLGLSEKQLKERCTKMDTAKIAHAYNQMATSAQELFTTSFDFKKVDCEYLELTIEENLLIDCVYISIGIWEGNNHSVVYRGSSIKTSYGVVKQLIESTRRNLTF